MVTLHKGASSFAALDSLRGSQILCSYFLQSTVIDCKCCEASHQLPLTTVLLRVQSYWAELFALCLSSEVVLQCKSTTYSVPPGDTLKQNTQADERNIQIQLQRSFTNLQFTFLLE